MKKKMMKIMKTKMMSWGIMTCLSILKKVIRDKKMYKCHKCGTRMVFDTNRSLVCPKCDKDYWDRETGKVRVIAEKALI